MLTKHEREHESPKGRWNGEDWCVECMRAERDAIREQVRVLREVRGWLVADRTRELGRDHQCPEDDEMACSSCIRIWHIDAALASTEPKP